MNYFINTLSWWQWAMLAAIPPAIIALYFLKLRRQPLEVPSTFLWRRTIEDLHVNSLWQRLRKSILLLLQLLLILLVMLAVLRPGWHTQGAIGSRFVILIDNSASMNSTDVAPTRLDEAKKKALEIVERMNASDTAMVVAFNDRALPVQQFTSSKHELMRKINAIEPTNRTTNISEALRLAAGLANPNRFGEKDKKDEVAVAEAQPAELFIFSDGRFPNVTNFDFGNLKPQYIIVGDESPGNVGITAFSIARNDERPDQVQAICRVENFGPTELASMRVSVYLGDEQQPRDTDEKPFEGRVAGFTFDLADMESGTLRVKLEHDDALAADNEAFAAINVPRRANVLLLTPRNDALTTALQTEQARKAAKVMIEKPEFMTDPKTKKDYDSLAATAAFDLIIYDQCAPEVMPSSNTLFIGTVPPGTEVVDPTKEPAEDVVPAEEPADNKDEEGEAASGDEDEEQRGVGIWQVGPKQPSPLVIDVDRAHPLMRYIELGNVRIAEATPLSAPPGGTNLIDADIGTIFAIAPRKSFEDAVLGFAIVASDEKGDRYANTDWTIRRSFPLFFINLLQYLGGQGGSLSTGSIQPGKTITIRTDSPVDDLRINGPTPSSDVQLQRQGQATFTYSKTDALGVYDVYEGKSKQANQRFAVNLFDPGESNIAVRKELDVGEAKIEGESHWRPMRRELWKWILLGGLGLLLAEWWIWNRRVYL